MSRPVIAETGQVIFDPGVDNERVHDEEIIPLIQQIISICNREGIPFIALVQYDGDSISTSACFTGGCLPIFPEVLIATKSMAGGPEDIEYLPTKSEPKN